MSIIQPATVQAIAQSVNVNHLSDEAARTLAPEVENRLREVIQDALKFARHCKRTKLTTQDVNSALRMRNIEPLYGFLNNSDPAKYVRATGHPDVYFVRDSMVPLEQITCAALPRAPPATTVMPHWLFIDGVQPATEENAAVERPPQQPAKRPRLNSQQPGAAAAGGAGAQNGAGAAAGRRKDAAAAAATASQAAGAGSAAADVAAAVSGAAAASSGGGGERVALPVQHILSEEMHRLLEQIKQVLGAPAVPPPAAGGNGEPLWGGVDEGGGSASASAAPLVLTPLQRAMLTMVQTDPGMQQLLPYLVQHIGAEVAGALRHLPRLHMVLRIMQALLLNPAVQLEPYLASLMPPLLTCLMAKSLGPSPAADHWSLRDAAATLLARVCGRFGEPYYSLQVKMSKQLLRTLLDGSKPLPSHYGAVAGLAALGHSTVRLLLLPQLEPYLAALRPALGGEEARAGREGGGRGGGGGAGGSRGAGGKEGGGSEGAPRREGLRQFEARRVAGALTAAAAGAMYERLLAAAAEGLPLRLFWAAGRARGGLTALAAAPHKAPAPEAGPSAVPALPSPATPAPALPPPAAGPAPAPATAPPTYTPVPPPPPDPRLDAKWAQLLSQNPGLQGMLDGIVANPTSHNAVTQLIRFGSVAADPTHKSHDAIKAILHQLAKRGIAPPPPGTPIPVAPPPPAPPQAASPPVAPPTAASGAGSAMAAARESPMQTDREQPPQQAPKRVDAALQAGRPVVGRAAALGDPPPRTTREILADSWREDSDLGETVWALGELLGPAFTARLPQPHMLASMNI